MQKIKKFNREVNYVHLALSLYFLHVIFSHLGRRVEPLCSVSSQKRLEVNDALLLIKR